MGLDFTIIETFILVADLHSFSGAAKKLGLTQPAVSFQVRALENQLGASLFNRTPGKVLLTPAGKTAYIHAQKMVADRNLMFASIPRITGEISGKLFIAASSVPGEYIIPGILNRFMKEHPEVTVSIDISDSASVIEMLRNREIELGFTGTKTGTEGLRLVSFETDRLVLISHPEYTGTWNNPVALESIVRERFINRITGSGTRSYMETLFKSQGIDHSTLNVIAELGSTQAVINAVAAGIGIAIISNRAAEVHSRSGRLNIYDLEAEDQDRQLFVLYNAETPLSTAADSFLGYCLHDQE